MSGSLGVAIPFWLDRPDEEAVEIARIADRAGLDTVWVGEMASFDAFALATAIGLQTERVRLKVGPLAVGVRSPVAIALGVSSVATLVGRVVDVALGASSPAIVSGWHGRPWSGLAGQMQEGVLELRALLDGERIDRDFKLRRPLPDASIIVAAFGPKMTSVGARFADELVLNLVSPEHVATVRARIDEEAATADRRAPRLAVWVPAALDPGERAMAQLASQLSVYLGAPGYGELFAGLGFGDLVDRARAGTPRAELAEAVPSKLVAQIGALGDADEILARVAAYHAAGADHVAIVPGTAEDPAGGRLLEIVGQLETTPQR
ncbi:MAG: LLM class F420-dependent oxidoreductase [Solirubrobacteraceae bacterium]